MLRILCKPIKKNQGSVISIQITDEFDAHNMFICISSTVTCTNGLRMKVASASLIFLFFGGLLSSPSMESSAIATFTDCSFRSWTILSNDFVLMLMLDPEGIERQRGFWLFTITCIGWNTCFDDAFKRLSRKYNDPEPLRLSIERPRMKAVNDRSHLHSLMKILSFTTLCSGYHGLRPAPQRTFGTCSINGSSMFWARTWPACPQNEHYALLRMEMDCFGGYGIWENMFPSMILLPWNYISWYEAESNTSVSISLPPPDKVCPWDAEQIYNASHLPGSAQVMDGVSNGDPVQWGDVLRWFW